MKNWIWQLNRFTKNRISNELHVIDDDRNRFNKGHTSYKT